MQVSDLTRPEAVIFDMDGLIFDTETLYGEALLEEAKAQRVDRIDNSTVQATVGLSWPATRELLGDLLPADIAADRFIACWMNAYTRLAAERLALKPGVVELLDVLEELNIPRALATGSKRVTVDAHLASHRLLGSFSVIITEDDCCRGKPDPKPFLRAAEALGGAPECCWALEDSTNGVRAAHSAGMATFMIPDLFEPDTETAACCVRVL